VSFPYSASTVVTQTLLVHTIPTTHSALLTLTTAAPQLPPPSPPRSTLKRVHFTHDTTLNNSNTTLTHASPTLQTPAHAIEARDRQVQRMTAERPPRAAPLPWPLPSPSARALFDTRHPTAQMRSAGYAATQLRMLWLADIPPDDRFAAFEKECFLRQLAPTTAATYWVAWLSCQASARVPPSIGDKGTLRLLEARAMAFPVVFPAPMSAAHLRQLCTLFRAEFPRTVAAVALAWLAGQRISDVLQLGTHDFSTHEDKFLVVVVRRGKVMSMIPPYPLALPLAAWPATTLVHEVASARRLGRPFLFSQDNSLQERAAESRSISTMMLAVDEDLELRSIRRGGLTAMAQLGLPYEDILLFSQHRDTSMLRRYLSWGVASTRTLNALGAVTSMTSMAASCC
jgi:integrase